MRRLLPPLLAAALLLGACGSSDPESTPTACLQGSGAYLSALEAAPGPVRLEGSVPISDCLVPGQSAGELNQVGAAMVEAATGLNERALRRPGGGAAERLGYLVGAVEEGAAGSAGIHTDLVRRINSAARFNAGGEAPGAAFERAFGAGYAAARESG
jgi:hypothetical protein